MIKLMIVDKDEYCNYVLRDSSKTYKVNINFIGIEKPSIHDYIYIPEKVLNEKVSLNYGTIENENINEDELILILKNNQKIYLQRLYG